MKVSRSKSALLKFITLQSSYNSVKPINTFITDSINLNLRSNTSKSHSATMDETFRIFHRVLSFAGVPIFARENWSSKPWLLLQILNFIIGVLCFVFTTSFVANNYSNLLLFIEGACIWTTGVIMTISLGVCLFFRNDFR